MSLTILYTDTIHRHAAHCDEIQSAGITSIVKTYMIYPADFDFMHIDLRPEIEEVICWKDGQPGAVARLGGGFAWNIYLQTAEIWPEINYHTAGRPAIIL